MSARLDPLVIDSLRELLGKEFGLLVETYISDGQKRIDLLDKALTENDLLAVSNEAHALKGSNRNLGIQALVTLAEQIETQTRQGAAKDESVDADLEQKVSALKQEFAATCDELLLLTL